MLNVAFLGAGIPDPLRHTVVSLLFKGGDRADCANYRPIALSNVIYKIYASMIDARLTEALDKVGGISDAQNGSRKHRTTSGKILNLTAMIEHANKEGSPIFIGYIDFCKAYDSVEHWAIRDTLVAYGFPLRIVEVISDIYSNNTTAIRTTVGTTDPISVTRGVRQGCPLSPLLFILFVDPLLR